jgi:pyruvate ferredoxin oxidoreductase alpha subunit
VAVLGGSPYSYFRYEMHLAAQNALSVYDKIAQEFAGNSGGATSRWRPTGLTMPIVFVMLGSFATKARDAVDRLRQPANGSAWCAPACSGPFRRRASESSWWGKRVRRSSIRISPWGRAGVLFTELASALYGQGNAPVLTSFIGGLGGRDITLEEFYEMAAVTRQGIAAQDGQAPPPRLLNLYRR